ncbi:MAG: arginine--tRNA ligase [Candidatus Moranbacteria bacterium]|nr:arginine--tRNA ligase [Candidatus Moranbacteria bacterium]
MKKEIQKIIKNAIRSAFGVDFELEKIKVDYAPEGMGDYSSNIALVLAKQVGKSPMEVAEELALAISEGSTFGAPKVEPSAELQFQKIEAAKPGFLNFWLADAALRNVAENINKEKNDYGKSETGSGKKVHLDFVSANPTGPIHVGNARGGPLGDTLANVFSKVGYDPYREYYVNDAGNQVEVLGHSILGDDQAQYAGQYIENLKSEILNLKSSEGFDRQNPRQVGDKGLEIILEKIIKPSMEKFGIKFDNYFSEKEMQTSGKVDEAIEILKEKNLICEKDGAQWFKSTQFGDDKDRVVVKSDGQKTYFGSDIAYHKEKFDRGFEKIIDIWGADHHGEVARTKGAFAALGYPDKLEFILTQFVRVVKDGKEVKMSKRAGTYVSIDDLVEEVGRDATRFFFLMHSADTHMSFDLSLAKEQSEKNPVFYVQYAHARISSILRKAEGIFSEGSTFGAPKVEPSGMHPKERALIFELLKFPDLVEEISGNYAAHHLPQYAISLADKFHSFYDQCRVIDEGDLETTVWRLEIVKATQIVLAETLRLMGISAPEHM